MSFIDPEDLLRIITELYDTPLDLLIESVIGEGRQWADLKDWEFNGSKWGVDENGRHIGSKEFTLDANDLVRTAVGGSSISKRNYVFLPMSFAMDPDTGEAVFKHIMSDVRSKGSVKVSCWPGYGVDDDGAYPALVLSKLPAETRSLVQEQIGQGGIIYAVDGVPLSQYAVQGISLPGAEGDSESTRFRRWVNPGGGEEGVRGGRDGGPVPEWLLKLSNEIDAAIRGGTIKAEISRIKGFEGELILSTPQGDAVMIVSKQYGKAAYVLRKKMNIDGNQVDYDIAISGKMTEIAKDFHRKPRGEKLGIDTDMDDLGALKRRAKGQMDREAEKPAHKRPPRFVLRDWLTDTDNGYALYRDVRAEDIRRLVTGGLSFEAGRGLAESPMEAESSFAYNLNKVLSEGVVMSEDTVQSFLDVMRSPWSMDEHKLFDYLKTLAPEEIDDWVSAMEIVVEQGDGDRWIHGLTERTLKELNLSQHGKARVQGILIDLQASPVDDPMQGPPEGGSEQEPPPPTQGPDDLYR